MDTRAVMAGTQREDDGTDRDPCDRAARLGSIFVAVLSLLVLALWLARPETVLQAQPVLFAMPFNAALCFLFSAGAVLAMLAGQIRLSSTLVLVSAALALVAVVEHGQGLRPAERFLANPLFVPADQRRGGMALNTALCFLAFDLAVMRLTLLSRASRLAILLFGAVLLTATGSMLGTVLNIAAGEDWMPLARMSPQTALCFAFLVLPLFFRRAETLGYERATLAAALGAAVYLLVMGLSFTELRRQRALVTLPEGTADVQATLIAILLVSGLAFFGLVVYASRLTRKQRMTATELAGSNARLAAIFDHAADGIVMIDARGIILSVNPACERIFGYETSDMIGREIGLLMPGHAQSPTPDGPMREAEGVRRDGSAVALEISTAYFQLGRQRVASAILRDVSLRKRQERQILEANAELEEFSYRTSHDLRSPIASSLGLMAICRDMIANGASLADLDPVLTRVETGFRRLDHLIQNIILLTRTKVMEEPSTTVRVAEIVRDSIDRTRLSADGGDVAFLVDIDEAMIIDTKPSRFRIIVDTLISNAVRYADPAEAAEVQISANLTFGRLMLSVTDNGLGIDPADERNLFQMFKRFHPSRAEGSGLGLYILRKSVEHLGGTVAYRRRRKGSEFVVRLPQGDQG